MSKELSASTIYLSKSREGFIEVYIDNQWIIVIALVNTKFLNSDLSIGIDNPVQPAPEFICCQCYKLTSVTVEEAK